MRFFFALIVLTLTLERADAAEGGVAGRYMAGGGSDVRLLVTIQKPVPAAFIVVQQIPPGVRMTSASPAPSGFVRDSGAVKWLVKRPRPGSVILSMQLSGQVAENQLHGEISYRHPENGSLVVRRIGY